MPPAALAHLLRSVAREVWSERGLDPATLPVAVPVQRTRHGAHGDYATGVALDAGPRAGVDPRELAGWLVAGLTGADGVQAAQVTGPGFVGLRLTVAARLAVVADLLAAGERAGTSDELAGRVLDLRPVPVDPTAPPTDGARATAVLAALTRLLEHAGARVAPGGEPAQLRVEQRGIPALADIESLLGPDAARYALLRAPVPARPDLDLARWVPRTAANPLLRVQLAHARSVAAVSGGAELGLSAATGADELAATGVDAAELALADALAGFAAAVAHAAQRREPGLLARYLEDLAARAERARERCPALPVGDEDPGPRHAARLALHAAVGLVVATGLGLLGIAAAERL